MPQPDYIVSILIQASDAATEVIENVANSTQDSIDSVARGMMIGGGAMAAATAPFVAGMVDAVNVASSFESQMADLQTILGYTDDQMNAIEESMLDFGQAARAGPQGVAAAFAEIAGGVEDTSIHMAILEASISTAQAGQADLIATTNTLVSVMNSYGGSAEFAAEASDVLTQTVAMGVGSMEEFGAALPQITGLASSLGIEFENLGAAAAYLTTKGFTASEAATQLKGMMTALLKPNATMIASLEELGVASGDAAIEQYGLVGAYEALINESPTFAGETAAAVGQVEALNGVVALTNGTFSDFEQSFIDGAEGMTAAAEKIQLDTVAAQTDILNSQIETLRISIGLALLPAINRIVGAITPVVQVITDWARKNPQLVQAIAAIVAVVFVFGTALAALGGAIALITPALPVLAAAFAAMTGPLGLVVLAIAALAAALATDFMGIRTMIESWLSSFDGMLQDFGINISPDVGIDIDEDKLRRESMRAAGELAMALSRVFRLGNVTKNMMAINLSLPLAIAFGNAMHNIDWGATLQGVGDNVDNAIVGIFNTIRMGPEKFALLGTIVVTGVFTAIANAINGFLFGNRGDGGSEADIESPFDNLPDLMAEKINSLTFDSSQLSEFGNQVKMSTVGAITGIVFNVADFATIGSTAGSALWDSIIGGINVNIPIKIPAATAAIGGGFGGADLGTLEMSGQEMGLALLSSIATAIGLNSNSMWVINQILPPITGAIASSNLESLSNTAMRFGYAITNQIGSTIRTVATPQWITTEIIGPLQTAIATSDLTPLVASAESFGHSILQGISDHIGLNTDLGAFIRDYVLNPLGIAIQTVSSEIGDTAMQIGIDLVLGIIDGINDRLPLLEEVVRAMAGLIPDPLKEVLGMKSPSKVMMEIGRDTVRGLEIGLEQEGNGLLDLSAGQISSSVSAEVVSGGMSGSTGGSGDVYNNFAGAQFNLPNISNARDFLAWLESEATRQNKTLTNPM